MTLITWSIYVPLLNKGVDASRPVSAVHMGDGTFRILGSTPAGEQWEFATGEVVHVKPWIFADGRKGLLGYEKVAA